MVRLPSPDLEEVDVSVGVAEAEDVLLLGVLGHRLDDAVLGQQRQARVLQLRRALPVGLIEQQGAAWGERSRGFRLTL